MPETDIDRGREVAARFRSAVREMSLAAKSSGAVEVSIGLSDWRPGQDWQAVYKGADVDLYEDKRRRRLARHETVRERTALTLLPRGRAVGRRATGS